jgi:hypothetical protein
MYAFLLIAYILNMGNIYPGKGTRSKQDIPEILKQLCEQLWRHCSKYSIVTIDNLRYPFFSCSSMIHRPSDRRNDDLFADTTALLGEH